jgi:hypothetical protein
VLKCSLFYGRPGVLEVGYDNDAAKAITGIFGNALKLLRITTDASP